MQEEVLLNGPKAMKPSLIGKSDKFPSEGPNKVPRSTKERTKGWHEKRMRKKECDIGDKMLINKLKQGKFQAKGKHHHKSSTLHHMVSSHSNDEGNILR